jgi:hypothetical protein
MKWRKLQPALPTGAGEAYSTGFPAQRGNVEDEQ